MYAWYVFACLCMPGRQRSTLGVFLSHSPLHCLRQGLSVNLRGHRFGSAGCPESPIDLLVCTHFLPVLRLQTFTTICFLNRFWGSKLRPHAWTASTLSTHWTIHQAPKGFDHPLGIQGTLLLALTCIVGNRLHSSLWGYRVHGILGSLYMNI